MARPCSVEGCERQARARGYCNRHYQKLVASKMARSWSDVVKSQSTKRSRCIVGYCCEGLVVRTSEQGHGLCAKHRAALERGEVITLGPGFELAKARGEKA